MMTLSSVTKAVALSFLLLSASAVLAQACPTEDSRGPHDATVPSMLHGTLIYHDELRIWLGLKLDQPACGETEIQLIFDTSEAYRKADSLRNCGVTATGKLFLAYTAYYSARMAIGDPRLVPDDSCHPLPIEPDLSKAPVSPNLQTYYVSITIDTRGKGHTAARVSADPDAQTSLTPWQAYAHYWLNGAADLAWFGCREGFSPGDVVHRPQSSGDIQRLNSDRGLGLNDDSVNKIDFTCRRSSSTN